jgi:hypothetical protein
VNARKTSQLFVSVEDRPGELAKVLGLVSDANVNIVAYCAWGEGSRGQVMLITEDNLKIRTLIEKAGFDLQEVPVVIVEGPDVVGSGAAISQRVADAGINLRSAYATCVGKQYLTVLICDDAERLVKTLSAP